ncbi:polymorphic toxin-type HINT domain-containing protein [Thermoactinomyces sp. DSM 45892]|uniref:polymorphic toxin-type HINT domain-containing protein n=1 Tax=Thermoactinomyces sp. DSM 45892 TaxID=1882753 RepID=UPI000B89C19C|nr:polymorphic toxin-type HINT domain-containing protein [Thermoactinomyces sp. DSM 45892]
MDEIYEVHIGGEVIQTTDEHPFWVIGEGWVPAKDLRKGDLFETDKGKKLAVDKIVKKKQKATVYNFKVKDFHTYYVSNLKVLTHNTCGPKFGPGAGPDFIVTPGGTAVPIPKNGVNTGLSKNGKGTKYEHGSGGHDFDSRTTGVRIMDSTSRYPNGYGVYMNKSGQTINPYTG